MKRWFTMIQAVLLSGCAILPGPQPSVAPPAMPELAVFAMNGRVSVTRAGERNSAGLRWAHLDQSDEILLLGPLGQTAARIYRDAGIATLDSGGEHNQAGDVEALMEGVLGWHLPLRGLHHWVLGMPDGENYAHVERDAEGRIALLVQNGWEIRYLRYTDNLPSRMQLQHADLQVLLLIDAWDWNPE